MRIRVATVACLLVFGSAHAQPAPDPTPPPPDAPPGQGEAEIPNFQVEPMEQPLGPPTQRGPGSGPRGDTTGPGALPSAPQTLGDDVTAAEQPQAVGLEAAAATVLQSEFPALVTDVTIAVPAEGMLEVDGVVPVLSDKLEIHDALAALPESEMVVNRIDVEPPRRPDSAIERDARRALRGDELLRAFPIEVETRKQRVFLSGRVTTPLMAQTALRAVAGVRGVRDVNIDQLRTPLP